MKKNLIKKIVFSVSFSLIFALGIIDYTSNGRIMIYNSGNSLNEILSSYSNNEADTNEDQPLSDIDGNSSTENSDLKNRNTKVDINSAGIDELQIAPGIGPSKAQNIIDYRNSYGPFSCVDELIEVKGIGQKTLDKIKDYYMVK